MCWLEGDKGRRYFSRLYVTTYTVLSKSRRDISARTRCQKPRPRLMTRLIIVSAQQLWCNVNRSRHTLETSYSSLAHSSSRPTSGGFEKLYENLKFHHDVLYFIFNYCNFIRFQSTVRSNSNILCLYFHCITLFGQFYLKIPSIMFRAKRPWFELGLYP